MNKDFKKLEKNLGYSFQKKEALVKALTHVSKSKENNEVFEFQYKNLRQWKNY